MIAQFTLLLAASTLTATAAVDGRALDGQFAPPVEITAGGKAYRDVLYPSPVLHDLDGDGQNELVIGDLRGFLYVSKRVSPGDLSAWGPSKNLKATDGKDLKFSNW